MNLSWLVWNVGCRVVGALVALARVVLPRKTMASVVDEINCVGVRWLGLVLTPHVQSR